MWTVNDGIEVLKAHGAKITTQRVAILKRLEGRKDHPSADTLYKELLHDFPSISVATVYSTAQLLADSGLIKILSIDDKRVYFDPATEAHAHFLCRRCGQLFDVPLDEQELYKKSCGAGDKIAQIERAEVFFYGVCSDCMKI